MHAPFLSVTPHPRSAPHSRSFVKSLDRSVFLCALFTRSCGVHLPAPEELSQGRGPRHDGLCGGEEGHQRECENCIHHVSYPQTTDSSYRHKRGNRLPPKTYRHVALPPSKFDLKSNAKNLPSTLVPYKNYRQLSYLVPPYNHRQSPRIIGVE